MSAKRRTLVTTAMLAKLCGVAVEDIFSYEEDTDNEK